MSGLESLQEGLKKPLCESVKVELSCNGSSSISGKPGPWGIYWGTLLAQRGAIPREKAMHATRSSTLKVGLTKSSFEAKIILSCSRCWIWSCRVRCLSCEVQPIPGIPRIVGSSFILKVSIPIPWNSTRRAQILESPVEGNKGGTYIEGTWKSLPTAFCRWHPWGNSVSHKPLNEVVHFQDSISVEDVFIFTFAVWKVSWIEMHLMVGSRLCHLHLYVTWSFMGMPLSQIILSLECTETLAHFEYFGSIASKTNPLSSLTECNPARWGATLPFCS